MKQPENEIWCCLQNHMLLDVCSSYLHTSIKKYEIKTHIHYYKLWHATRWTNCFYSFCEFRLAPTEWLLVFKASRFILSTQWVSCYCLHQETPWGSVGLCVCLRLMFCILPQQTANDFGCPVMAQCSQTFLWLRWLKLNSTQKLLLCHWLPAATSCLLNGPQPERATRDNTVECVSHLKPQRHSGRKPLDVCLWQKQLLVLLSNQHVTELNTQMTASPLLGCHIYAPPGPETQIFCAFLFIYWILILEIC